MAELPYYFPEGKRVSRESLIPIIILILIGVVLIGKTTNVFCGVPGLKDVFCPVGIINIAIVGDLSAQGVDQVTDLTAPNLAAWFESEGASKNIYLTKFSATDLRGYPETTLGTLFGNYQIVILAGERHFTREISDAVGSYIQNGGNVIIIGDAAVQDPDDLLVTGWGGKLYDKVPVRLNLETGVQTTAIVSSEIQVVDINHPIYRTYGINLDLTQVDSSKVGCSALNVLDVVPQGAGTVAMIKGTAVLDDSSKLVPGVVEGAGFMEGKVFYIAYDPGCTPNMWISTVNYILGL